MKILSAIVVILAIYGSAVQCDHNNTTETELKTTDDLLALFEDVFTNNSKLLDHLSVFKGDLVNAVIMVNGGENSSYLTFRQQARIHNLTKQFRDEMYDSFKDLRSHSNEVIGNITEIIVSNPLNPPVDGQEPPVNSSAELLHTDGLLGLFEEVFNSTDSLHVLEFLEPFKHDLLDSVRDVAGGDLAYITPEMGEQIENLVWEYAFMSDYFYEEIAKKVHRKIEKIANVFGVNGPMGGNNGPVGGNNGPMGGNNGPIGGNNGQMGGNNGPMGGNGPMVSEFNFPIDFPDFGENGFPNDFDSADLENMMNQPNGMFGSNSDSQE
jgi:hypothetical protein